MNKVGYIGAGVGVLALAAMANAINKSKDLNAKLKLNTLTPGNISANLGTFQVTGNFPIELVNQSSFDITLSNLYVNIAHKNEASQWEDLLIQKNGISQVTFKKNVATKLGTIPLSMAFSKIPSLIKIITGKLPRTLLVTTRFEVAGFELDPIQTEIDATSYLQPVTAVLKSFGLLNGSGAGIGYSSGVDSSGYQPAGIGYNSNYHYRKIKDATDYVGLMPVPKGGEMEIRNNGTAYDTIDDMAKIVSKTLDQTKKLSAKLKSPNQEQSVKNVWEFLYHHIQYKQDTQGVEELRDPARSFADRKTGIDCDCFSIFASSILTNMGIDHYIEMCAIHPDPWFKHVYVIVPKEPKANISQRQNYWVVDACLHKFDQLAPNISQKYSKQMRTVNLNGLGAACACKTSAPKGTFGKQPKVIQAPDKAKLNEMALHVLEPMKQQLIATKQQAIQNPGSVELLYKPAELVKAIDFALVNWGHPDNRDKALSILAQQEDSVINKVSVNGLMGIGAMQSLNGLAYDPTKVYPVFGFAGYGLDGLGSIQVTELTGLFSSIKKTAENVGNAVKNVATKAVETVKANPVAQTVQKATQTASNAIKSAASFVKQNVQKVNPIMVTARTAYRGLVSLNFRGQATKLAKGMSTPEGLKKLQNFWTSELIGGNWGDLVAAINAGKSKKELLGGIDGLGVVVAATVAASVATATPILIKIAEVIESAQKVSGKVETITEQATGLKKIFNTGKSAIQNVQTLVQTNPLSPATNQPTSKQDPGTSISIQEIEPQVNPNKQPVPAPNPSESKGNGVLYGILGLAAAAIAYAISQSGGSNKNLKGVPSYTI